MTRYCASGARSHFSPHLFHALSAVRIYKDYKGKRAYGTAHQNSSLILDMLSHMPFCIDFVWY